jgi:hypothetical protein
MPGSFAYTKSTNTLVVTGGTSGSPAGFADLIAADRAGSVTLLASWAPNSNTKALTYQITPVELLALLISFVVASKTTETDYIFITGTDAWGAAQTESIDISAGNGTYVSTKRFRTVTNISCSDNPAGGGTLWANGTVAVTQPQWGVIWLYPQGAYFHPYRIDCRIDIGDGSTSTYFLAQDSLIYVTHPNEFYVKANATYRLGSKISSNTTQFGCIQVHEITGSYDLHIDIAGTLLLYGSNIYMVPWAHDQQYKGSLFMRSGSTTEIINSLIKDFREIVFYGGAHTWTNVDIHDIYSGIQPQVGTYNFSNVKIWSCRQCNLYINCNGVNVTFSNLVTAAAVTDEIYVSVLWGNANVYIDDSLLADFADINWGGGFLNFGSIWERFSLDINICGPDGSPLSGAVVDCQAADASYVWAQGSLLTDANGNIASQKIPKRKAYHDADGGHITTYSPHKLIISKAGYLTLILENITLSAATKWHHELQPIGHPPAQWEDMR